MLDIDGFKEYLYEEELAPNTIATYVKGVEKYAERFDTITKPNLIEFKRYLVENYKPQTVNLRITALLTYCKYKGIEMKLKQVKLAKKTSIDNVISLDQYNRLIDGLKRDNNMRWYITIVVLARTGMRISEALKIRKSDIINGKVTLSAKAHMRTIFFPKTLTDEILPYLSNVSDDDFVLQNHNGQPITSRGVSGELRRFADKYGIPKEVMHPHSFRHFFAIEFVKRNNNISLLADLLGHGSVNITQIYLRQSEEQQKTAVDNTVNW